MCKVYLFPGTHEVRIHVDTRGKQAECPVIKQADGSGLIIAPSDREIRNDICQTPGLLQVVRSLMPGVTWFKISAS